MVVIKQFPTSGFTSEPSIEGRLLFDSTLKAYRFHNSVNYNNILINKDNNNNVIDINNLTLSGNINISNHDRNLSVGLTLNGTLVTSTASQLNYTNTTQGMAEASKALILDLNRDIANINSLSSDQLITNSLSTDTFNTTGNVGINTTALDYALEVNSEVGDCLKLTYNDSNGSPSNYVNFNISSSGDLLITPSGNNVDITTLDGATTGLKLGNTLITATAIELNYVDTTQGIVESSKAMVVDNNRNLSNLNNLSMTGTLDVTGVINFNNVTDATSSTSGGCLTIDGGAAVAKKLYVGSSLDITGPASLSSTLAVTSNTTVGGTLGVTGAVAMANTLDVTGATALLDTLDVTGATALSSTLAVTSNTTVGGTLGVTGAVAMANTLAVTGAASLSSTLAVTSNTTVGGTLGVTGAVAMANTLDVTGATALLDTLDVTGATALLDTLDVTGATVLLDTLDVTGATALSSTLAVTSNTTVGGTLGVTGAVAMANTLDVTGATALLDTLDVTGATALLDTLDVTGATALSSTLAVTSNTTVGGTLGVTGAVAMANTLAVTGAASLSSTLAVTSNTTVGGTLGVTGAVAMANTLAVTGATALSSTLAVTSNTTVGGTLEVTGGVTLSGDLTTIGNLTVGGPILSIPTGNTATRPASPLVGYVRYNTQTSQFEGYGAGNSWGSLGGVSDVNQDTKILAEMSAGANDDNLRFFNNGAETMRLTAVGKLGIGTNAPDKQVEINSTTGDCLRLTYNDADGSAVNYTDFVVSSSGDLSITPSGNDVDITTHNGSTTGLKLGGVLVTATAAELNYTDTTPGTAEASKALIMDSNRNIININYLETAQGVFMKSNINDDTVDYPISILVTPNTSATNGLGSGIEFNSVNANNDVYNAGYISYISSNVTNNSETGFFDFKLANNGVIDSIMTVGNSGVLTCTSLVETSDIRVKENIEEVDDQYSLNKILQVNVKSYNFINDQNKKLHSGVIAQEIKEILPEVVEISNRNNIEDFHGVNYTGLIPHLINCIKNLQKQIDELKK
jgi:hypothetical protein